MARQGGARIAAPRRRPGSRELQPSEGAGGACVTAARRITAMGLGRRSRGNRTNHGRGLGVIRVLFMESCEPVRGRWEVDSLRMGLLDS